MLLDWPITVAAIAIITMIAIAVAYWPCANKRSSHLPRTLNGGGRLRFCDQL